MLAQAALVFVAAGLAWAQPQGQTPSPGPPPMAAPLTVLVDDLVGLFPKVQGEVLEVHDASLTLDVGRRDGARPGLEVELYREGREIKHPKTGAVLGKAEESLGRSRITDVQEAFSLATRLATAAAITQPASGCLSAFPPRGGCSACSRPGCA